MPVTVNTVQNYAGLAVDTGVEGQHLYLEQWWYACPPADSARIAVISALKISMSMEIISVKSLLLSSKDRRDLSERCRSNGQLQLLTKSRMILSGQHPQPSFVYERVWRPDSQSQRISSMQFVSHWKTRMLACNLSIIAIIQRFDKPFLYEIQNVNRLSSPVTRWKNKQNGPDGMFFHTFFWDWNSIRKSRNQFEG